MSYRVTNSMIESLMLNDMHSNLKKLVDIQQQMATERKYNKASDNPNAVTKGMMLDTYLVEGEQYISNLRDAQSWLKFTDDALGQMNDAFQRIRELAIQAGNGAYEGLDFEAIAVELSQLKEAMRSYANSTIGSEYLFSGMKTCQIPFGLGANGEVVYNGNDHDIYWEFSRSQTGQVSISGRDVFPLDEITNYLKGTNVPIDFQWAGRSEILEFKVGWQTVKVRIPEKWSDESLNGLSDATDYNRYRDPGEALEGYTLDEIAALINNSTEMGDVSRLLKATVVKDLDAGTQYLQIQSLTGESVQLTSWADEDTSQLQQGVKGAAYGPLGRSVTADGAISFRFSDNSVYNVEVLQGESLSDIAQKINNIPDGKMWAAYKSDGAGNEWIDLVASNAGESFSFVATGGAVALVAPEQSTGSSAKQNGNHLLSSGEYDSAFPFTSLADGTLSIKLGNNSYKLDVAAGGTVASIAAQINALGVTGLSALVGAGGELEITSTTDEFEVTATGGLQPLYGNGVRATSNAALASSGLYELSTSEITQSFALTGAGAMVYEQGGKQYWVDISAASTLDDVASALNTALAGVVPGFSATVKQGLSEDGQTQVQWLDITSQNGPFTLSGFGDGASVIGSYSSASKELTRNVDHSHIGFAAMMGLETALQSMELALGASLGDTTATGNALHIKFTSPNNSGEVFINDDSDLTLEELAARINSVCGSWLQAVVVTDEADGSDPSDPLASGGDNKENATQRLVLRTLDGSPFAVYDGSGKSVSGTQYAAGSYAQNLGIATAQSSSIAAGGAVSYPVDPSGAFDEDMPAMLSVKVGDKTFQVKVCRNNCGTAEKVAAAIVRQVNEQYGSTLLAWDGNDIDPSNPNAGDFALYAVTGEPLRITDSGYGDPRFTEYTGGVAMQLGIAAGITSDTVPDTQSAADVGTIRIMASGRQIDVPVLKGENLQQIAARIRDYAGSWLDVSFADTNMGATSGGWATLGIAAKDGSAVSIIDISGTNAVDFGLDTGLVGTADLSGWQPSASDVLTITVNGVEHTIDLYDEQSVPPGPVLYGPEELAEMINLRFQGQDVRAEVITTTDSTGATTKRLAIWSPKGYTFEMSGNAATLSTLGFTANTPSGAVASASHGGSGPYNQNVALRTGDNQKKTDFFGIMDNLIASVEGGNVDGISDVILSQLDSWMSTLLQNRALAGALTNRYSMTESRLTTNNTGYEEIKTNTVGVDLAEVVTRYAMASGVYEASLAAIARIMQPTLLDFLR